MVTTPSADSARSHNDGRDRAGRSGMMAPYQVARWDVSVSGSPEHVACVPDAVVSMVISGGFLGVPLPGLPGDVFDFPPDPLHLPDGVGAAGVNDQVGAALPVYPQPVEQGIDAVYAGLIGCGGG